MPEREMNGVIMEKYAGARPPASAPAVDHCGEDKIHRRGSFRTLTMRQQQLAAAQGNEEKTGEIA
ncbi:hypothetical protein [Haloarcula nitratireducens]|uniref:Uncharacterized protein n=1 Tax=Haloarcula nitratireducens TaxID=2487749 RepID=A0AAW4PHR2_9EURY|nr:hypothetical protein [Halomicroarcula nitratireducens]MBX0297056.1 hypothetical protein [Halomicroarcula nitratireducens]